MVGAQLVRLQQCKGKFKRFYKIDIVNFSSTLFSLIYDDDDDDAGGGDDENNGDNYDDGDDDLAVTRTLQKTRRVVVHL